MSDRDPDRPELRVETCPACDDPDIEERTPESPWSPYEEEDAAYHCGECGHEFEEPASRAPKQPNAGLDRLLEQTDKDAVPDGGLSLLGDLHAASVLDTDDGAVLALKGTKAAARVRVPESQVEPLRDTVCELGVVYGLWTSDVGDQLIGDGGRPEDDDVAISFALASELERGREEVRCDLCGRAHRDRGAALRCCSHRFAEEVLRRGR